MNRSFLFLTERVLLASAPLFDDATTLSVTQSAGRNRCHEVADDRKKRIITVPANLRRVLRLRMGESMLFEEFFQNRIFLSFLRAAFRTEQRKKIRRSESKPLMVAEELRIRRATAANVEAAAPGSVKILALVEGTFSSSFENSLARSLARSSVFLRWVSFNQLLLTGNGTERNGTTKIPSPVSCGRDLSEVLHAR